MINFLATGDHHEPTELWVGQTNVDILTVKNNTRMESDVKNSSYLV